MALETIIFDTQNEVKQIATTNSATSAVDVKFEGNFDSGNFELGYTDTGETTGTFFIVPNGTFTVDGETTYAIGRNQRVFARATGASPVINVKTTIVS